MGRKGHRAFCQRRCMCPPCWWSSSFASWASASSSARTREEVVSTLLLAQGITPHRLTGVREDGSAFTLHRLWTSMPLFLVCLLPSVLWRFGLSLGGAWSGGCWLLLGGGGAVATRPHVSHRSGPREQCLHVLTTVITWLGLGHVVTRWDAGAESCRTGACTGSIGNAELLCEI